MNNRRWWLTGAVLVMVVTLLLGWVVGVSPLLSAAKAADEDRVGVEAQNALYGQQLALLKAQFDGIDELTEQLDELRIQLPAGADLPGYVAQLINDAQTHSVAISSLAVSDAVPYAPVVVQGAVPASEETPATPAPDAEAQVAAPAAGVPLSDPLVTADNFVAIPVSISVDGDYANVLDFLESLRMGTRLTTVTSFTTVSASEATTAGSSSDATPAPTAAVEATISAFIYVLLGPAGTE